MKILAIEFSSPQRSAAVVNAIDNEPQVLGSAHSASGTEDHRSTDALGLVESALREAHVEREQIECLAIGIGPGSYTGIRAAIALAQGWELARGVKLLGISSAATLAAQAQAEGLAGRVEVVIDAQRNEVYLAGYEVDAKGWREVAPLQLASLGQTEERRRTGSLLVGPEVTNWFPAGKVLFPDAATLGRLAAAQSDFLPGEKLEPIYLRETKFVKAPPPRRLPD